MPKNILHTIEKNMSSFSKGQKLIARFILEDYDKAAFMTASKLGKTVQVSESTVVRFATQLGYDGYPSMQRALQEMIRGKLTSIQRIKASEGELSGSDPGDERAPARYGKDPYGDGPDRRLGVQPCGGHHRAGEAHLHRGLPFLVVPGGLSQFLFPPDLRQCDAGAGRRCRHLRPALPRGPRRCGHRHLLPALLRAGTQDGAVCQGSGRDHHRRDRQRDVARCIRCPPARCWCATK